jgi:hypothetical protein
MHRFLNVMANHTIHVVFAADNFTILASASQGGVINPNGAVAVPFGTDKTFYFTAENGYYLAHVLIDGINNSDAVVAGMYHFTNVSDNHTISAQFEKKTYNVTCQAVQGAIVTPIDGSTSPVEHGGRYRFKVILEEGYSQSNIVVRANGLVINMSGGAYTINNIVKDQIITIDRVTLNQYKITAIAFNGGTISPAGIFTVTYGDSKTFEIIPKEGYMIDDVEVDGVSMGALESFTFTNIQANAIIKAYFKYNVGIFENENSNINVFSHNNIVTIVNEDLIPISHVEIFDMSGRIVWKGNATEMKTDITLNVVKGAYCVHIIRKDNQHLINKIVIK